MLPDTLLIFVVHNVFNLVVGRVECFLLDSKAVALVAGQSKVGEPGSLLSLERLENVFWDKFGGLHNIIAN